MVSMHLPSEIIDLTSKTPQSYRGRVRASAAIDAVVLHQTSMNRGNDPDRYLSVKAHYAVMPDGRALHLHPADVFLSASSDFNADSIAVEFIGNFRDDKGNWWSEGSKVQKDQLLPEQISGGRDLIRHLQKEYGTSFIFAHRQGELLNRRGNCPGPEIWYHIGQWALDELGMSDGGRGFKEKRGTAIPDTWRHPLK